MTDHELARAIADEAGALLLQLRKAGGNALGAEGDARANALILERLAAARPDDAVLSEERICDGTRQASRRCWIVDPLDGTREFGEGRSDWAVHIGLAVDGVATVGAVALPALGLTFATDESLRVPLPGRPLRMLVSRTRPAAEAVVVADIVGAELVPMGSAGAKAMAILRGEGDIYLHSGGQYEWDNCAPVAVALASGLHASRIDGSPLVYNRADAYVPDLLICRMENVGRVLASLKAFASSLPAA